MNILNSIIANNESARLGGGIMTQLGAAIFVKNTIVADNSIENCNAAQFGGVISSQGNNISSDDSCPFTKPADKQNTNPLLGPLQNNGGPTDTRALLPGSPAVDAANATACPQRDQRGVVRKDGDKDGTVAISLLVVWSPCVLPGSPLQPGGSPFTNTAIRGWRRRSPRRRPAYRRR